MIEGGACTRKMRWGGIESLFRRCPHMARRGRSRQNLPLPALLSTMLAGSINLVARPAEEFPSMLTPEYHRQQPSEARNLDALEESPFLKASIEDLEEVHLAGSRKTPNRRHVVCLMFDALEFVLYEILLLHNRDIYRSGQSTIGFDDALRICQELGVEIPRIGVVRQIQKHRGDAKHHAQSPEEAAYQRMVGTFEIIMSRLVYEQFEGVLGEAVLALPLLNHHVALFESYRRQRNHNWQEAYRFVLGALLKKHREMFGNQSGRRFRLSTGNNGLLTTLEAEILGTTYQVAPRAAVEAVTTLSAQVRAALSATNWEEAASLVGTVYSTIDQLLPGIFDIGQATRLTSKLYLPRV